MDYRQPTKAALEASYSWALMYDWLDKVADDVVNVIDRRFYRREEKSGTQSMPK